MIQPRLQWCVLRRVEQHIHFLMIHDANAYAPTFEFIQMLSNDIGGFGRQHDVRALTERRIPIRLMHGVAPLGQLGFEPNEFPVGQDDDEINPATCIVEFLADTAPWVLNVKEAGEFSHQIAFQGKSWRSLESLSLLSRRWPRLFRERHCSSS